MLGCVNILLETRVRAAKPCLKLYHLYYHTLGNCTWAWNFRILGHNFWLIRLLLTPTFCHLQEFELTIDLDSMLAEMDKDHSGSIDYAEFKTLLGERSTEVKAQ